MADLSPPSIFAQQSEDPVNFEAFEVIQDFFGHHG